MKAETLALDEIFTAFGFEAKPYLFSGRQYHGLYKSKEIHIYLRALKISVSSGSSKYMGHDILIYLDSPLKTRSALTRASSLNDFLDRSFSDLAAVPDEDLKQAGFDFKALEFDWGVSLLSKAKSLMLGLKDQPMSSLRVYPEAAYLAFRLDYRLINKEKLAAWLELLYAFTLKAEAITPLVPVEETKKERAMRFRSSSTKGVALVMIGIVAALVVITFSIIFR